mgnify:FL=1
MKKNKFFELFFISVLFVAAVFYFMGIISAAMLLPILVAYILNLLNTFTAIKLFDRSINGSNKSFLINVLGGMGIRILFLLISILLIIKVLNIDKYIFIFTFFIIYFFLLVAEIVYYNTKLKLKKINVDNGN